MNSISNDTVELFRDPGSTHLSPVRAAELLGIDQSRLASGLGVHPNTMRLCPRNRRTQERLLELSSVFQAMLQLHGNSVDAAYHLKNTPIQLLGQRTLFEAIAEGDSAKALRYLQTVSGGQNG